MRVLSEILGQAKHLTPTIIWETTTTISLLLTSAIYKYFHTNVLNVRQPLSNTITIETLNSEKYGGPFYLDKYFKLGQSCYLIIGLKKGSLKTSISFNAALMDAPGIIWRSPFSLCYDLRAVLFRCSIIYDVSKFSFGI